MLAALLTLHVILAVCLVIVIVLQKSEGGGLGVGGGNFGGMMTVRGTANFLTRLTSFLAGGFLLTSLLLAIFAGHRSEHRSLFSNEAAVKQEENQATQTAPIVPAVPAAPVSAPLTTPSAPLSH